MESRAVYLGIATRLRGGATGALGHSFLHSAVTEALWYAVTETERLFDANLSHAVMLASMYGHPDANLDKGNEQIHDMYLSALGTMPYMKDLQSRRAGDVEALVEEWKRMNAEDEAARDAKAAATAAAEGEGK